MGVLPINMSQDGRPSPTSLGSRLQAALTDDQIKVLLEVAAEAGQLGALDDALRAADQDLADTVRRVLDAPSTETGSTPSSQRTIEIWSELWGSWESHVAELEDHEGTYVNHEEHWHPPYLDHGAFEEDLEEDANRLLEWIDRAFPLIGEPNLFLESLREIGQNMRSLPEWFQAVDDDFVLGTRASLCVLRWTWLGLASQSQPGRQLVDAVCSLEIDGPHAQLDPDAASQFFKELPEEVGREIHAYLREPQFAERLTDRRSLWHLIQHGFERQFDPAAHLRACEEHLEQDWHYGEPLIADAVSRQDLPRAERFVELTLSSLLRWPQDDPWHPEKLLLPQSPYYRPPEESQAISQLLNQWESIAARRGNLGRVASLRLQGAVLRSPEDWTVVIEGFREYERDPANRKVSKRLFAEWRQRVVDVCAPPESRKGDSMDTWTHWLINAQVNPSSDQETFLEHVDVWLECCGKHVAFFQKNWRTLALLTRSLPDYGEAQAGLGTFHAHVLVPAVHVSGDMEKSLRRALESLGAKANRIKVGPVWEQHLQTLVPSPGGSGSYYRDSAMWMRALSEVNPSAYLTQLAQWRTEHRRRRNLWADMASAGCPHL